MLVVGCAHHAAETTEHTVIHEPRGSRVDLVEQPGMRLVELPATPAALSHVTVATVTRPSGSVYTITHDNVIAIEGGRVGVRLPLGLAGAVHVEIDDGTVVDFNVANSGNTRDYCAWSGPATEVVTATLLELGYGRAAVLDHDEVIIMSEPHDGLALRVELQNMLGTTRFFVRAVPEDAPHAQERIDTFFSEMETSLELDGCPASS